MNVARRFFPDQLNGKLDPSDVVQDTLLAAHRHLPDFRGTSEAEFAGWLKRILINRLVDLEKHYHDAEKRNIGRERRLEDYRDSTRASSNLVDERPYPRGEAVAAEEARVLRRAMGTLSADYQQVLMLRNWDGLPFAEVSQQMGRSTDSVRKLWARAVDQLQQRLNGNV